MVTIGLHGEHTTKVYEPYVREEQCNWQETPTGFQRLGQALILRPNEKGFMWRAAAT